MEAERDQGCTQQVRIRELPGRGASRASPAPGNPVAACIFQNQTTEAQGSRSPHGGAQLGGGKAPCTGAPWGGGSSQGAEGHGWARGMGAPGQNHGCVAGAPPQQAPLHVSGDSWSRDLRVRVWILGRTPQGVQVDAGALLPIQLRRHLRGQR